MNTQETILTEEGIQAWARLIRVSQDLLQKVEVALKQAGLPTLAWYDVLLEVKRAEPDSLRPYQLQKELLLAQYNLSRLLDRMAAKGVLERRSCEEDGRGHSLHLTPAGRELMGAMWSVYSAAIARHFTDALTEAEVETLGAILLKLKNPR